MSTSLLIAPTNSGSPAWSGVMWITSVPGSHASSHRSALPSSPTHTTAIRASGQYSAMSSPFLGLWLRELSRGGPPAV